MIISENQSQESMKSPAQAAIQKSQDVSTVQSDKKTGELGNILTTKWPSVVGLPDNLMSELKITVSSLASIDQISVRNNVLKSLTTKDTNVVGRAPQFNSLLKIAVQGNQDKVMSEVTSIAADAVKRSAQIDSKISQLEKENVDIESFLKKIS